MHSHELLPILGFLEAGALRRTGPLPGNEDTGPGPGTYLLRGTELARLREAISTRSGGEVLLEGYQALLELAERACGLELLSVFDKAVPPNGGSLNDYCSLAKYAWPDPEQENGMPYILRDGEPNPEFSDESRFDAARLERLSSSLFVLSIAHYLSNEQKYGEKAAALIRHWFIDGKTRQNPDFRFAQIVPGREKLRGIGIIEARRYLYVVDAAALLAGCDAWTDEDRAGFRSWIEQFFTWLRTSSQGAHAASRENNIGLWYDLQCATYALFLGERKLAETIVRESHSRRLSEQVAYDGSQPRELERDRPYDYVVFNLLAMLGMARAGEMVGFDSLWTDNRDGRSFERALDWLLAIVRSRQGIEIGEVEDAISMVQLRCEKQEAGIRLAEQEKLASQLQSTLEECDVERERLQRRLDEVEAALSDEAARAEGLEARVGELQSKLQKEAEGKASDKAEIRKLQARVNVVSQIFKQSQQDFRQTQRALANSHNHLREVYASRSWRVTAPMRKAMSWVRGQATGPERNIGKLTKFQMRSLPHYEEWAQDFVRSEVRMVKSKLLNLGFHERGLQDLRAMVDQGWDANLRRIAAWELAVWHANRYTENDARESLRLFDIVSEQIPDHQQARFLAVLKAESHHLLGNVRQAYDALEEALTRVPHADLYLGMAGLEESPDRRLACINHALRLYGLAELELEADDGRTAYDRLRAKSTQDLPVVPPADSPAVSIIIPAYNAGDMIGTTIKSLLVQTWENIEILVADDCSTDHTCDVVEEYVRRDSRVRLLRGERNAGPYVARNLALQQAKGEFITCNDSDDWSHPRKIEIQVTHLLAAPRVMANTSPQARMYEDMTFYRRGNPGFYVQLNMSSLMFRRMLVEKIGYWDSVRFAADSEFTRRIKTAFGNEAIVDLEVGPLSFQRQTEGSLTGSDTLGYHGFKMGARRTYEHGHSVFHKSKRKPFVDFPLASRPFVVPEPMRPDREVAPDQRRHFDVVLVSDFRMPGGTSMSNIEEIKAQCRMGLRTGLVQMSRYDGYPGRPLNPKVMELVDGNMVDLLVYGERIACDLLVVRLPWVLEELQEYVPDVEAKQVRVIVNQPPKRDYAPGSENLYHLDRCAAHLVHYFGNIGMWHPIGPLVREALLQHHAGELGSINLSDEDWSNIIDVSEWARPGRPERGKRIRIGRHSRDQYVKWPASRDELLMIYPDSELYEIRVLGGADEPRKLLGGKLPANWRVKKFGEEHPRHFLRWCDVFVYFTHPDWVESFGRVIFEAMAVGVPVILPKVYEPVFREAACYAEPSKVRARIDELMADDALYQEQVARARAFVERNFGYSLHAERLEAALGRELVESLPAHPAPSAAAFPAEPPLWVGRSE